MAEEAKITDQEKLEQLIRENIKLTQEIHQISRRMNRYITFQNILSAVYFLLIVIPLIMGAIYLPHFMENVVSPYQNLLKSSSSLQDSANNSNPGINDIINQAQKLLNESNKK